MLKESRYLVYEDLVRISEYESQAQPCLKNKEIEKKG